MKCRICGVLEGAWFQRRADGSTQWRPCTGPILGDREWFPGQLTQVRKTGVLAGVCTGIACGKQALEKK
jgi:hypothetical protein